MGGAVVLRELYNSPLEAVSWAMRGLLVAAPGHVLMGADFSNIEGRGIAWLSGEQWKLQAFRDYDAGTGPDLYKVAAGKILNLKPEDVSKTQRQLVGKPAELGLGYGGGVGAILTMMRNGAVVPWIKGRDQPPARVQLADVAATVRAGVSARQWNDTAARYAAGAIETAEEILAERRLAAEWLEGDDAPADEPDLMDLAAEVARRNRLGLPLDQWTALQCTVDLWRASNSRIHAFWRDLERAAFAALQSPGEVFAAGEHIRLCKRGLYLVMRLPSGRCIHYPYAKITTGKTRDGREREQIICMRRVNGRTGQWFFRPLYGGLLAENATQAVARDVLRDAMIRLHRAGYRIVLHVHDEIVCEMPTGRGDLDEMCALMAQREPWAAGLPVAVSGWSGRRFRK